MHKGICIELCSKVEFVEVQLLKLHIKPVKIQDSNYGVSISYFYKTNKAKILHIFGFLTSKYPSFREPKTILLTGFKLRRDISSVHFALKISL